MTSATDELRRMLDERGVWHEDDEDVTRFFGPDGFEVVMQWDIDGKLDCLTPLYLTPAQAIVATLGNEGVGRSNDGVAELEAENARLRELVKDYEHCSMHADCSRCEYDGKLSTHCPLSPCFPDTDELRNIGVEVEE